MTVAFDPSFEASLLPDSKSKASLSDVLIKSTSFVAWLETYKNKVQGVPNADTYMHTYKTMKPEVQRVQALQDFVTTLASALAEQLRILQAATQGSNDYNSAVMAVVRLLDIASVVNFMKMFSSAIMNDFAMFKRSFQQIRGELPTAEAEHVAQQSHALHFFLANPNSIIDSIKGAAEKEANFDQALSVVLEAATQAVSNAPSHAVNSPEYNALLRSVVYSIYVLDGQKCDGFKLKAVKNARNIVRSHPLIPVHNNLTLSSLVVIKSTAHWEEAMEKDWQPGEDMACAIL